MATTPVTKEQVEKRIIEALVEFGADPDEMRPEATMQPSTSRSETRTTVRLFQARRAALAQARTPSWPW